MLCNSNGIKSFIFVISKHLNTYKMENTNNEAFKITGEWPPQAAKLQEKFKQLTDADLKFEAGKENELISRISSRINKKHGEVIDLLKQV